MSDHRCEGEVCSFTIKVTYTASCGSAACSVALTALLARVLLRRLQVHAVRKHNMLDSKGLAYYYDEIHPDGNTGHRYTPSCSCA
jgi:hypothetical protein